MTTERSNISLSCNCQLTRCHICHKGLNSNYIRVGARESFKKVGLYCIACDIYYSPNLQKQYTVINQDSETVYCNNPTAHRPFEEPKNKHKAGCSGRDLNPGSATRKAAMLDRIVQLLLLLHHRSFNLSNL